jgi:hypothetical protein
MKHKKGRRFSGKKIWLGLSLVLVLCGAVYWLKCEFGFNIFEKLSISSHFPFRYLNNDVLNIRKPSIIFFENFEHKRVFDHWSNVVMPLHSNATWQVAEDPVGDHSRCLEITYQDEGYWSYPFQKYISVNKGDIFYFEGSVYLERDSMLACLCIAAYDGNKTVTNWGLAMKEVVEKGRWIKIQKQFTIADENIRYIAFRLIGAKGVHRFDNLMFSKLK